MATQSTYSRGLQPTGPAADDNDLLAGAAGRDDMRQSLFSPHGGVMTAHGGLALIDPVHAIPQTNTRANAIFFFSGEFIHQIWIGHLGAGHAHQIDMTVGDRVAGRRNVGYAAGM